MTYYGNSPNLMHVCRERKFMSHAERSLAAHKAIGLMGSPELPSNFPVPFPFFGGGIARTCSRHSR